MTSNGIKKLFAAATVTLGLGACTRTGAELGVANDMLKSNDVGVRAIGLASAEALSPTIGSAGQQVRAVMAGNGGRSCDVTIRRGQDGKPERVLKCLMVMSSMAPQ